MLRRILSFVYAVIMFVIPTANIPECNADLSRRPYVVAGRTVEHKQYKTAVRRAYEHGKRNLTLQKNRKRFRLNYSLGRERFSV